MKYKVGDCVKIRKDLKENDKFGHYDFIYEMKKFRGKLLLVKRVEKDNYSLYYNGGKDIAWVDKMIEKKIPKNQWSKKTKKLLKEMVADEL